MSRRTKIVCTLGPATGTAAQVAALVDAGMDVARLNLSHGSHAEHAELCLMVRQVAAERGREVGVMADLQGPKIRLGRFADGPVLWSAGEQVVITTADCPGDHDRVSTTYRGLAEDLRPDDRVLVDDGRVELRVSEVVGADIRCLVVQGGPVDDHKGLSLPGVAVGVPPLTEKDVDDLRFALHLGVDLVAMSFVRSPEEVKAARDLMEAAGRQVPVIVKLEKPEAVADLPAIVDACDGLMVARGDLGVELPLEQIPLVQKRAVRLCRERAKPVIVATQMLDSMVTDIRPTRAEVSDVANAVFDGADAVMLSAETSIGVHPAHTVATMARIVEESEADPSVFAPLPGVAAPTTGDAIAAAACEVAERLGALALCCFTRTGATARRLARRRPRLPLLAFTHDEAVRAQLTTSWGIEVAAPAPTGDAELPAELDRALLTRPGFTPGGLVVVVSGSPYGVPGSTNSLRVLRLSSIDERAHEGWTPGSGG